MKSLANRFSIANISIWFIFCWLGLFVFVPGILVVLVSFLANDPNEFYATAFSLEAYKSIFDPLYSKIF